MAGVQGSIWNQYSVGSIELKVFSVLLLFSLKCTCTSILCSRDTYGLQKKGSPLKLSLNAKNAIYIAADRSPLLFIVQFPALQWPSSCTMVDRVPFMECSWSFSNHFGEILSQQSLTFLYRKKSELVENSWVIQIVNQFGIVLSFQCFQILVIVLEKKMKSRN